MAVAKKRVPIILPPPEGKRAATSGEPSLLVQRLRELDREFARQTNQLTKLAKELSRKIVKKQ